MQDLHAVGVQCFTNDRGKAMDGDEYMPLYDAMAEYDRRSGRTDARAEFSDYLAEDVSQYEIWWTFGWPTRPVRSWRDWCSPNYSIACQT